MGRETPAESTEVAVMVSNDLTKEKDDTEIIAPHTDALTGVIKETYDLNTVRIEELERKHGCSANQK